MGQGSGAGGAGITDRVFDCERLCVVARVSIRCKLRSVGFAVALALLASGAPAIAQRFYPDDPIWKEPPPRSVGKLDHNKLYALVDFYNNTVHKKGQRNSKLHVFPSEGINTLGEVYDSTWYTNRHDLNSRMPEADLVRGPNVTGPPDKNGAWKVVAAKAEGVTPGFTIEDSKGRKYLLKFDPPSNAELATAADVICAKFLFAAGYNVPENYIVTFQRDQLALSGEVEFTDPFGRKRAMRPRDIDDMLKRVARGPNGDVRALASLIIPGEVLGGFKFYKHRAGDPNEIAPHEHMRVLRALHVFSAWLNHTDHKALNTLDVVVEENGRRFVRHFLIDFGSALGSDGLRPKDPRLGHEYMIAPKPALRDLLSAGLYVPLYARLDYPDDPAVGNIASATFRPDQWKTNYPNAAFLSRLPGDEYWAAKKVLAFSDSEIRAIVATGEFSDPESVEILSRVLIARRDIVARTFIPKLLSIENARIEGNTLRFDDLAAERGLAAPRTYEVEWTRFDNLTGESSKTAEGTGMTLPAAVASAPAGSYWAATLRANGMSRSATLYFRRDTDWKLVGIDREGANDWEKH